MTGGGKYVRLIASTFAILAAASFAQTGAWPAKPVRIIVPFAPGGSADTLGRTVAARLTETFGQPFIVENRGGGGGLAGAESAARATADGYTLVVTGLGPLIVATTMAAKPPYDPLRDFTHIALFGGPPSVLGVHPSVPARDVKGFVALAKARPGALTYGTAGRGSTGEVVAEMLKQLTHADIRHVPYKGAAQAVVDLVGGHIDAVSVTLTTVSSQIRAGKVRALAMSSEARVAEYPDVPTFTESGYPQIKASVWFSLSGPAGMPPEIVNRLNAEVRRTLQLPDVRQRLRAEAIEPGALDAKAFTAFVAAELARWAPIVRSASAASPTSR